MDILGKWKVAYARSIGEDGFKWLTLDEALAANNGDSEMARTLSMILEFAEGGKAYSCIPIPPEVPQDQIDEAVKAGEICVKDGCMYDEAKWKEEDGKYFYYTAIEGKVLGEETSPWMELPIGEDGMINFMGMYRYTKI